MSGYTWADVERMLRSIREDLSRLQGRVSELATAVASFDLPAADEAAAARFPCRATPPCGFVFSTEQRLEDHMANVHDGPRWLPEAGT